MLQGRCSLWWCCCWARLLRGCEGSAGCAASLQAASSLLLLLLLLLSVMMLLPSLLAGGEGGSGLLGVYASCASWRPPLGPAPSAAAPSILLPCNHPSLPALKQASSLPPLPRRSCCWACAAPLDPAASLQQRSPCSRCRSTLFPPTTSQWWRWRERLMAGYSWGEPMGTCMS